MVRRNKQISAVLALVIVAAVVVALALSDGSSPSGGSNGKTSYTGTATVQRRNLVATDTESGTLSYANAQTVYNRLNGTITWLPTAGQVIKPGHTLFDIDNSPVLLMDGPKPAYRDLSASDTAGPDILELNRNLVKLGYDPDGIVVDDEWQYATTAGVEALQTAEGWTVTGTLTLGQVVFLPGPQLVSTVDATVGSTGGSAASLIDPVARDLFVSYPHDSGTGTTTGTTTTGTTTTGTTTSGTTGTETGTGTGTTPTTTTGTTTTPTTSAGKSTSPNSAAVARQLAALKAELQALKNQLKASHKSKTPSSTGGNKPSSTGGTTGGGTTGGGTTGGGDSGGSATAILQTTSTQLVVTVDLDASLQSEATVGERVNVEMPDGSTVGAKVTGVSSVAQSSDSGDDGDGGSGGDGGDSGDSGSSSSTIPVTITLDKRAKGAGLDQAAVSVNFTQSKANNVLSIPVTALIATSGQQFAVQEAVAPYKLIPVTTGLFAAGYVQVSGTGIYSGLQISDSQG